MACSPEGAIGADRWGFGCESWADTAVDDELEKDQQIQNLKREKTAMQNTIQNLPQEEKDDTREKAAAEPQNTIQNWPREKDDLMREMAEQRHTIQNLTQKKADLTREKAGAFLSSPTHTP